VKNKKAQERINNLNIPIAKTVFKDSELKNILKPLKSGWVVQGKYVKEFEDKWCKFTGAKNSVAVTSCTTALHLSLAALGVKEDDEILLPSFTWIATANAVEYLKAKPVFCDIDIDTFNINIGSLQSNLTKKTKGIIPVHLFGLSADMNPIIEFANKNKLLVIEDAACGFGAEYNNIHVGNFGNTGCFSFHPRKAIGGMITTNSSELAVLLRALRDHGATISDFQRHNGAKPYLLPDFPYLGYNYRMTDIQASIGTSQMDRASKIKNRRKEIAEFYNDKLDKVNWIKKPFKKEKYSHGYQSYVCLFEPEEITLKNISKINKQRNDFMEYLQSNGISTRPGTHAVHLLKYYSKKYKIKPKDFPNAYIADKCSIALPLFVDLTNEELNFVTKKIVKYKIKK
jgi:dTDP-4-amino-4,6-dideoxygalactose transaminase